MRLGPLTVLWSKVTSLIRRKASNFITQWPAPVGGTIGGWWPYLRESFAGAWQRGIQVPAEDALTHPTFWACATLIAGDIAKMRPMLVEADADGIRTEVQVAAYSPVLRRPNHYQNRIQFYTYWILSKLTRGNAYALKERDNRGVVTALYLLDPTRVHPMVTPSGDVYYALGQDVLSGVSEQSLVVPAREIIHDVMYAPYHPLCGLSPIYACGHAAAQALKIMTKSARFFANDLMLGGLLVAPGEISEEDAKRLEAHWNTNYAGEDNAGKVAAIGGGMRFEKPTRMSAVDAQLIQQLKWNDEKICSTFHVPTYMVGVGPPPNYNNIEALNQQYYSQCLQILVESLELCLDEGLELKGTYRIEFDLEGLLRMDSATKMETATKGVKGGIFTPNDGRRVFNKRPLPGGNTVYLQEQDHALEALAKRDAGPDPFGKGAPPALPAAPDDAPPRKALSERSAVLLFQARATAMGLPVPEVDMPDEQAS